jgi:hypothetical protein
MAYMDQERKAKLAPAIKAALSKYRMKATIAVRHHSTLVINIAEGALDIIGNHNAQLHERSGHLKPEPQYATTYLDVNPYWYKEQFTGRCLDFVRALIAACNEGNHDNSDIMTDYHDVGWYVDINVGKWDKPYRCTARKPHLSPGAKDTATLERLQAYAARQAIMSQK